MLHDSLASQTQPPVLLLLLFIPLSTILLHLLMVPIMVQVVFRLMMAAGLGGGGTVMGRPRSWC